MGLRDRIIAKYADRVPDYAALAEAALAPDDGHVDHVIVVALAAKDHTRIGGNLSQMGNQAIGKAISMGVAAAKGAAHIGGPADGIARQLPREGYMELLAISRHSLVIWDLNASAELTERARVPLGQVASFVTTTKVRGGAQEARLSFTDGSHFDYRCYATNETFWATVGALGA